jgi:hypothetical protein
MRMTKIIAVGLVCLTILGQMQSASAAKPSEAESALAAAANQNRYMFVTFYKGMDDNTAKMIREVKGAVQDKLSDRASFVSVDIGAAANGDLVIQYDADRAKLPLTVVVAPNGALTAGFQETIPGEVLKAGFRDVFVSSGMAQVLKALQDGKLAAVCFQNAKTKNNKASSAAAKGLFKDKNFRGAVELIYVDPAVSSESKLLKMCSIDAATGEAQLVIIAPPGKVIGAFPGATTKEEVISKITDATGGGCSGGNCGPGGCG